MSEYGKGERAAEIIGRLRNNYNYKLKQIAGEVGDHGYGKNGSQGVDHSTIARLADPNNRWSISDSLLGALEAVLADATQKYITSALKLLPFRVLDYCGVPSDLNVRRQLEDAVSSALRSLPASPRSRLPDGIEGVLVSLGDEASNIFLIITDSDLDSSRRRIVAHELEHIANRLRDASDPPEDDESSAECDL